MSPDSYPVGIVGEASYQANIRRCSCGQKVRILHEPKNPYDHLALAVVTEDGDTIGYVSRSSWLRVAIHEEGKGCDATIKSIDGGSRGDLGVVLDVALNFDGIGERAFSRSAVEVAQPGKGWFARLFGM